MQHTLPIQMFCLAKQFLSRFMESDLLPDFSLKELLKIKDQLDDSSVFLQSILLYAGEGNIQNLDSCEKDTEAAYREAAKCLLANLPLSSTTIPEMAALDPGMRKSTTEALAQKSPNAICPSDLPKLRLELADCSTDSSLDDLQSEIKRIYSGWWCHIFKLQEDGGVRFPFLPVLAKVLLSVFSEPLIESTVNLMNDVARHDRCSLHLDT